MSSCEDVLTTEDSLFKELEGRVGLASTSIATVEKEEEEEEEEEEKEEEEEEEEEEGRGDLGGFSSPPKEVTIAFGNFDSGVFHNDLC
jgi:CO dehydrogenase/acetyl-CoA synthase beta subunit